MARMKDRLGDKGFKASDEAIRTTPSEISDKWQKVQEEIEVSPLLEKAIEDIDLLVEQLEEKE